jgi:pimeloyl-ACP methyl ester carboxylesterase
VEPIIANEEEGWKIGRDIVAVMALKRKRVWGSRGEAEGYFGRVWGGWDERVRRRWGECALVDVDGEKGEGKGKVELAWGRLQEVAVFMDLGEMRESVVLDGKVEGGKGSAVWTKYPARIWDGLRDLAVPVVFVCGKESTSSTVGCKKYWKEETGTNKMFWGRGYERRVEFVEMEGVGHLVLLERPGECAAVVGKWIDGEMVRWWKEWEKQRKWRVLGKEEKENLVENWMAGLKSRI